ncbi:HPP family protein [Methylovulum psychrotolerans]|uniref:CBS domain-containing protein n=1 Tax=Methylovulum psychrotolerans TaxID=1704499 RepID=A0A2S5CIL7_9GAMM|nr:HPP family protein [Methylovulum psychrotolerans]POZ50582.1 hypothetical protein AADEFJLK_03475 [Methylovulum psychrotolerans]
MRINDIFQFIRVDAVNLSLKAKFLSVLSGSIAIFVIAWVSQQLVEAFAYPAMAVSMGASAVILFILPSSPLAQPWPLVGGQLVSALIGGVCAQAIDNSVWASGCAVGGSILAMLLLRCLYPPGAATALIPVIDRARRVIGIITWNDFFKFIDTEKPEHFSDKFKAFIRRMPDIHTGKPESVGHIISRPALAMSASRHIADLIPLMSNQVHRQIPIVNDENRLIGMVYQAKLIAAFYNQSYKN